MEMPEIKECKVTECSYNSDQECRALAITVGHATSPMCDTFWKADTKGGDISQVGRVGACHMSSCVYNKSLECQAGGISVGLRSKEPDCMTFKKK